MFNVLEILSSPQYRTSSSTDSKRRVVGVRALARIFEWTESQSVDLHAVFAQYHHTEPVFTTSLIRWDEGCLPWHAAT